VVSGIDVDLEREAKVAVVGANGAGKTTLLKLLGGQLDALGGERRVFELTRIAYFAQHAAETLDGDLTVLEAAEDAAPEEARPRVRSLLGSFLFTGADVMKPCRVLSGGERQRVALARILLTPANLILLDEPTHHLDLAGKEVLEDALEQFPGSVVVVTHDRSLMARLATRVLEVNGGRAVLYPGGYDDYEAARLARKVEALEPTAPPAAKAEPAARPRPARPAAPASSRRAAALARLESDIEAREARLREVETLMGDPAVYTDGSRVKALVAEARTLREELDRLWEALSDSG
jgi:ATP-binding cassette subfamily F protein 3